MSQSLTIDLTDSTYIELEHRAQAAALSPAELAAATLEQRFGVSVQALPSKPSTEAEKQAARERFERHFGAVNLGRATGVDNEAIDQDLAQAYSDSHEGS